MFVIICFIITLPLLLVGLENFDSGKYEKKKNIPKSQKEIDSIENIFIDIQNALSTQNMELLRKNCSSDLVKQYEKKFEQLKIQDKKIHIKNPFLEGLTCLKPSKNGFSVLLSFKAISFTIFNKDRVEIHWNMIEYCFTPQGDGIEGSTNSYTHFKQRWWFSYNGDGLQVNRIKDFYTANK